MLSKKTIQLVKEASLEDVLRPYLDLKRQGSSLVACCPFHEERTPSFTVTPGKNLWHCFGCGKGGDAIAFIEEKEGMDFNEAVKHIAKMLNIPIEYATPEETEKELEAERQRESLDVAIKQVQKFFIEQYRADSSESRNARIYAESRWAQDFCAGFEIGLAPKDASVFMDYVRRMCISQDALIELGILRKNEKNELYPLFRERITIPIYNKTRKIIGFTARYIGADKENNRIPKYINSAESPLFNKEKILFGIDKARVAARKMDYILLVEGAPDVLKLRSIGIDGVVATLGTSLSEYHISELKSITDSVCFIPDRDPVKDGAKFGAGTLAVMKNGSAAIRAGLDVSVREIPEQLELVGKDENGVEIYEPVKADPDSYIDSQEKLSAIEERPFVVWYADTVFAVAESDVEKRKYVNEIADLLNHMRDAMAVDLSIDTLAKKFGRVKIWRDTMARVRAENNATETANNSNAGTVPEDRELQRRFGIKIMHNMVYMVDGDNELTRLSNFRMEPMYHIKDNQNSTRIFKVVNEYGYEDVLELKEEELCTLSMFQKRIGYLGNFIWKSKIEKLNLYKEYLYAKTETANLVSQMGWNPVYGFFAFGNGLFYKGRFMPVDKFGMVRLDNKVFYLPAESEMYRFNREAYQFERSFRHETRSGITLREFASRMIDVFGDNAKIGISFLLAAMFRDIIFPIKNGFPILNLFGLPSSGKTTMATTLQSFFVHGIDPPNIGISSIPSMNDRVSQVTNGFVVFDEYKNDIDERKIAYFKALWGGTGQVKKNMNGDGKAMQTIVTSAVAICGQEMMTRDIALLTRTVLLNFIRDNFTPEEHQAYNDLKDLANLGNTHLTLEILRHRTLFEDNFRQTYSLVRRELSLKLAGETITDRIIDNWVVPLAALRTLETVLDLPFSYTDIFDLSVKGIRFQNSKCAQNNEMSDFWTTLDAMHSQGRVIEKAHFRIKYANSFRAMGASNEMVFPEPAPILFINPSAVAALYMSRSAVNGTNNRGNWSTIESFLKTAPSYLGMKQMRFQLLLANGTPDTTYENVNGSQQRKVREIRPKAMCFDYRMLKDKYNLNLESFVVADSDDDDSTIEESDTQNQQHPIQDF